MSDSYFVSFSQILRTSQSIFTNKSMIECQQEESGVEAICEQRGRLHICCVFRLGNALAGANQLYLQLVEDISAESKSTVIAAGSDCNVSPPKRSSSRAQVRLVVLGPEVKACPKERTMWRMCGTSEMISLGLLLCVFVL